MSLQHSQKCQKCKKVVARSGNLAMDQYVSWGLPKKTLAWIQSGITLKSFASLKQMK